VVDRLGHGLDRSVVICLAVVAAILLLTGLALAVGTSPASAVTHPRPVAVSGPGHLGVPRVIHH
jgi:hypothetical protein